MKNLNINFIKQTMTSFIVVIILTYFLFASNVLTTKIIIIPFLTFSLAFFLKNISLIFNKVKLAEKFSKIYVIAFLTYWFGFLIYWDYISLINEEYISFLFSLLMWAGGIYISYKKFNKK